MIRNDDMYIFRKIKENEVSLMFQLILDRLKWMDKKNINHWNVLGYDKIYPISYYEEKFQQGHIYALVNANTNEILSAAVLLEEDESWENNDPSIYIHNFISKVGLPGIGKIFLKYTEDFAKLKGKKYLRLDSSGDNAKLTEYYNKLGFIPVGTCVYVDGRYKGVLRQKEI
ncbi:hypothetical protein PIROE2DRAFT_61171 [Piromyces sp. E2]|nr:hypothetical protein PIROE2DRAFT_61171 [Piromyces sp. E2]|eukprot:OUM63648.1 hypothetical protein PIROE2DRAFT_61171 [Piromyces sp. E2]